MTFNPAVPNAAQSPGVFPTQNNTNFTRLKTIINADHVFNDTAAPNDGFHRQVTLVSRGDPVGADPVLYSKLTPITFRPIPYWWDGAVARTLAPWAFPQIFVAVNFDGTGGGGAQTIRGTPFNVNAGGVTRVGVGRYLITFANALPDTNYIVQVCAYGDLGTNGISNGFIDGQVSFSNAVKTTSVNVAFNGSGSSLNNVEMACVIIWRYQTP